MMADPDPINPLNIFVRILFAIFLGIFLSMNAHPSDLSNGGATVFPPSVEGALPAQVLTVIENVDALLLESFPVQINLHVTGYQPDGCDYPVQVSQSREGNSVTVTVYRELPPDILCTMQLVPYDETISLDGSFEPGEYTIDVNGTVITVTI
jgi:inhibitor of cysteine peptidase